MDNTEEKLVDIREQSPIALAFVGDGVIELLVRARLAQTRRLRPSELHRQAVKMVSAKGQFAAFEKMKPLLSEEEMAVFKRGRNANKASVAKNATQAQYRVSTGIEALFGWLYLKEQTQRIQELFECIWQHYCEQLSCSQLN